LSSNINILDNSYILEVKKLSSLAVVMEEGNTGEPGGENPSENSS
jgi:hypothetical protein